MAKLLDETTSSASVERGFLTVVIGVYTHNHVAGRLWANDGQPFRNRVR
jgi:hypothetical protein